MSDWRVDNAKHTKGALLEFKKYVRWDATWDHDHCEACMAKFMETGVDVLTEGYATANNYRWICRQCFHELKDVMDWKLA